jgi:hypothetical protein
MNDNIETLINVLTGQYTDLYFTIHTRY